MIYFIIMTISLIGVISALSFGVMEVTYSTQQTITAQSERSNLTQVTIGLTHTLRRIGEGQSVAAPVGVGYSQGVDEDGNSVFLHQTLPKSIGISNINKFGLPYIYCPVSNSNIDFTLPLQNIPLGGSDQYSVATVKNELGDDYVVQSDSILDPSIDASEVIAFIISPLGSEDILSCKNIVYSPTNNVYSLSNGIVSAITKSSLNKLSYSQDVVIDFADKDIDFSINDAFSSWSIMKPKSITLLLPQRDTPYSLRGNISLLNDAAENNMSVLIKHSGPSGDFADIHADESSLISLNSVNIKLEGIRVSGSTKISSVDANIIIDGGSSPDININNGSLSLKNNITMSSSFPSPSAISATNSSVMLSGGNLIMRDFATAKSGLSLSTSQFTNNKNSVSKSVIYYEGGGTEEEAIALANSSHFACDSCLIESHAKSGIKLSSVFEIDRTSSMSLTNSQVIVARSYSGIDVMGSFIAGNSSIAYDADVNTGFRMSGGARLSLDSTNVGYPLLSSSNSLPVLAVVDAGGSFISGTGSYLRSSGSCWSGRIFGSKADAVSGSSEATEDMYRIFNQSIWQCNN